MHRLDSAYGPTTTVLVVILFDDGIAQAKYLLGCILRPARSWFSEKQNQPFSIFYKVQCDWSTGNRTWVNKKSSIDEI